MVFVYRPPVDSWVLEFPAGMVDQGETIAAAAVRELQEETGLNASMCSADDVQNLPHMNWASTYPDPWKSSENYATCLLNVDADMNTAALASREPGEAIVAVTVPADNKLLHTLKTLTKQTEWSACKPSLERFTPQP